jgi:Soluble lytic murein transglycosylase and related regulatory proteins (some contain LysM/invasin domains)
MTPNKCPSLISELLTWIGLAVLCCGLAIPLVFYEHRLDLNQVVTTFITPPMNSSNLVPVNNANYLPPAYSSSSSNGNGLSFLTPDQNLLKNLSDRRRSRPAFSRAALAYEEIIEDTARQHQVSPVLVKAVIQAESSFNPEAVSHKGAVGLMQVMPTTARLMGVHDPSDPQKNIVAGVKYLKMLLELFNDDERLAIAAYNCGPEALKRFNNQIPPYQETRAFVDKVMSYYNQHIDS